MPEYPHWQIVYHYIHHVLRYTDFMNFVNVRNGVFFFQANFSLMVQMEHTSIPLGNIGNIRTLVKSYALSINGSSITHIKTNTISLKILIYLYIYTNVTLPSSYKHLSIPGLFLTPVIDVTPTRQETPQHDWNRNIRLDNYYSNIIRGEVSWQF